MTQLRFKLFILFFSIALFSCNSDVQIASSDGQTSTISTDDYLNTIVEAYLYGYPLLIMNYTKQISTNTLAPHPVIPRAPINQLGHYRVFPDHNSKGVVKPNVDTYYSIVWFDLSQGPQVLHMPSTERYYLLPFYDAYTNVFASPGTRTHGFEALNLLIVGPDYSGESIDGLELIQSPTNMAWLIARIETYDDQDGNTIVRGIQDSMYVRPLAERDNSNYIAAQGVVNPEYVDIIPVKQMESLSIEAYINELTTLLAQQNPAEYDKPIIDKMAEIGIQSGEPFTLPKDNFILSQKLKAIPRVVHKRMRERRETSDSAFMVNNWKIITSKLGDYKDDYHMRSYVSFIGLGANLAEDAIYPNTHIDAEGNPLDGSLSYSIHMDKDDLPPAKAFWSLTAYNEDDFLIENEFNKFAINSKDSLNYNEDGSLDLIIQSTSPIMDADFNNWIPVDATSGFSLTMRIYWPEEKVLQGNWIPPSVVPVIE